VNSKPNTAANALRLIESALDTDACLITLNYILPVRASVGSPLRRKRFSSSLRSMHPPSVWTWTKLHEVCLASRHLRSLEAARRSRACAYLADDDHGPLALQEILLAGCPTVGVRTGASFVRNGETGVVVDRLPPGRQCAESDADVRALAVFMDAIEQAQSMDRQSVRDRTTEQFDTERIIDDVITDLHVARLSGGQDSPNRGGRHQNGRRRRAKPVRGVDALC